MVLSAAIVNMWNLLVVDQTYKNYGSKWHVNAWQNTTDKLESREFLRLFRLYRDPDLFFRFGIFVFVFLTEQLEVRPVI